MALEKMADYLRLFDQVAGAGEEIKAGDLQSLPESISDLEKSVLQDTFEIQSEKDKKSSVIDPPPDPMTMTKAEFYRAVQEKYSVSVEEGEPYLIPGKITSEGSITRAELQGVLSTTHEPAQRLYNLALGIDSDLKGRVVLGLAISSFGDVSAVRVVQTSLGESSQARFLEEDLIKLVKALRFPKPLGGGTVDVRYPFSFKPDKNRMAVIQQIKNPIAQFHRASVSSMAPEQRSSLNGILKVSFGVNSERRVEDLKVVGIDNDAFLQSVWRFLSAQRFDGVSTQSNMRVEYSVRFDTQSGS